MIREILLLHTLISIAYPSYLVINHNRKTPEKPIPEIYEPFYQEKISFVKCLELIFCMLSFIFYFRLLYAVIIFLMSWVTQVLPSILIGQDKPYPNLFFKFLKYTTRFYAYHMVNYYFSQIKETYVDIQKYRHKHYVTEGIFPYLIK